MILAEGGMALIPYFLLLLHLAVAVVVVVPELRPVVQVVRVEVVLEVVLGVPVILALTPLLRGTLGEDQGRTAVERAVERPL
jgi:hypothetical protein